MDLITTAINHCNRSQYELHRALSEGRTTVRPILMRNVPSQACKLWSGYKNPIEYVNKDKENVVISLNPLETADSIKLLFGNTLLSLNIAFMEENFLQGFFSLELSKPGKLLSFYASPWNFVATRKTLSLAIRSIKWQQTKEYNQVAVKGIGGLMMKYLAAYAYSLDATLPGLFPITFVLEKGAGSDKFYKKVGVTCNKLEGSISKEQATTLF